MAVSLPQIRHCVSLRNIYVSLPAIFAKITSRVLLLGFFKGYGDNELRVNQRLALFGFSLGSVAIISIATENAYAVEDAEYFAGARTERPPLGERAVSLERETGDEQVVGDGEVQHETHRRRALGGTRQRHDRQRVTERADHERHQIQHEHGVT